MRYLFIIASIFLMTQSAFATIIHVPGDQPTIQAGINASIAGDTVLVAPGQYSENINFNTRSIRVIGSGADVTTLSPASLDDPAVSIIYNEASGTEFSGFTVTGGRGASLVNIGGNAEATISHCIFHHYDGWAGNPVVIRVTSYARIEYNLFYYNGCIGCIGVFDGSADIINNTFNINTRGIYNLSGHGRVINNIITNSAEFGIYGTFDEIAYNCVWNNSPDYIYCVAGVGDISADPSYFDYINADFSLAPYSPCIDAGNPDPLDNDPDGTRNDMGAYSIFAFYPGVKNFNLGDEIIGRVIDNVPTFYWTYRDTTGGQSAYEIEVGSDSDWTTAEMWATGQIISSDTSAVYEGLALEDGQMYFLRIRVSNGLEWGGWHEFRIRLNAPPVPPILYEPADQTDISIYTLRAQVINSDNPDADPITFDFEIYRDEGLTDLYYQVLGIPGYADSSWTDVLYDLADSSRYWWRARVCDGYECSPWAEVHSFTTNWGERIYVPSQYETIQAAINAADDGSIIKVMGGTYKETIDFSGKHVKVIGSGPESVFLTPAVSTNSAVRFADHEGNFAQIKGFTIYGGTGSNLIYVDNDSRPTISGNVFTGFKWIEADNVVIRVISDAVITNNLFYKNGGIGCIGVSYGGKATILNNTFDSNNRGFLTATYGVFARNNIVTNSVDFGVYGQFSRFDYNCVWNNNPDYANVGTLGDSNISEDPLYIAPEYDVYFLSAASDCIDAGDPNVRYRDPDGSRSDIGAYPLSSYKLPMAVNISLSGQELQHLTNHMFDVKWKYFDFDPGSLQAGYEIEIGSDNDWTAAEMWATGQVYSSDTSALYLGQHLENGASYYLRMRINNGTQWGGWRELSFRMNTVPPTPTGVWPLSDATLEAINVQLGVNNVTDAEQDSLTYSFAVYEKPDIYHQISVREGVAPQEVMTSSGIMTGIYPNKKYYWRARAFDGYEYSYWTPFDSFTTEAGVTIKVPQEMPTIQQAIYMAWDGDMILVSPGVYTENINLLGKQVLIISSNGPDQTILQPENIDVPVFKISSGEGPYAEINGFTIAGLPGSNNQYVSLIYIAGGAKPVITGNVIRDFSPNAAVYTAAIRVENAAPEIRRNIFYNNSGTACIRVISGAPIIENNTLDDNQNGIFSVTTNTIARNNIITNSFEFGFRGYFGYCDYNCSWNNHPNFYYVPSYGENCIEVDPNYSDASQHKYRLTSYSPCVNSGDPTTLVPYYGGSAIDMGAFEWYQWMWGDANTDGNLDVADVVYIVNYVFKGGAPPDQLVFADCNGDCSVNVADAVYLISYIFKAGYPPLEGCAY